MTNSVKIQDTKSVCKNLLHFYIPIMKQQKEKLRHLSHLQLNQKPKILWNEPNQRGERSVL